MKIKSLFLLIALLYPSFLWSANSNIDNLKNQLQEFVKTKDARIGIAVIINDCDTIDVNGNREFPMMSVFKFPIALAVAHFLEQSNKTLNDSIKIFANELRQNTYSPMLKKYGATDTILSFKELMSWSLVMSDNNACDILINSVGGTSNVMNLLQQLNIDQGITIGATESDMDNNNYLCYLNRATPIAMASLFNKFYNKLAGKSDNFMDISLMMNSCQTGADRLAAPLKKYNAIIGHKTGTGYKMPDGRLGAINDCGFVTLPDTAKYSIAVFVADSKYDSDKSAQIIAEISSMVVEAVKKH